MTNYLFAVSGLGRDRLSMNNTALVGTDGVAFPGNLIKIRYIDGLTARTFGLYAYTDGGGVLVGRGVSGESLVLDRNHVSRHEPMIYATALFVPDGRVFVDENRLTVGNSDKQLLQKLKETIPQLYQEMGELIMKATASGD